ncbi:double zinc ribbon domain-containing protein [Sporomusa malonica]|uniref:Double zinc ribbon n=1 Tax=Sporomusa malonica TaxID=112901 RepID=A0A1W2CAL2_9FIRM|nr:zinc ribbon domain-containing protein [Sporomusa malonica]SMC82171.1 Double zinc ribbon [Sporomusa malonica]
MPKSILHDILISAKKSTNEPQNTAYLTNKVMIMGSVLLFISAFIFIKNHSITALILGVCGIAVLIAGATKNATTIDNTAQNIRKLCGNCAARCESDWTYCAQCGSTLTTQSDQGCPHCGMKTETDWKFCAHCTKLLN